MLCQRPIKYLGSLSIFINILKYFNVTCLPLFYTKKFSPILNKCVGCTIRFKITVEPSDCSMYHKGIESTSRNKTDQEVLQHGQIKESDNCELLLYLILQL